jgi:hypothetical protein
MAVQLAHDTPLEKLKHMYEAARTYFTGVKAFALDMTICVQ